MSFRSPVLQSPGGLVESLGLRPALEQRRQESELLAGIERERGKQQSAQVLQQGLQQARRARERQASRRGFFETIGSLAGAGIGGAFGGLQGATIGASLGQAGGGMVSGAPPVAGGTGADIITSGLGLAGEIGALKEETAAKKAEQALEQEKFELEKEKTAAGIEKTRAETRQLLKKIDAGEDIQKKRMDTIKTLGDLSKSGVSPETIMSIAESSGIPSEQVPIVAKSSANVDRLTKLRDTINKDKGIESARGAIASGGAVTALLETGNPISAEAVKLQLPRLLGEVGNLSDSDKAAFGGSKAIKSKINQAFKQWGEGTLTSENKMFLDEIVNTLKENATNRGNARIEAFINSEVGIGGIGKDEITPVIEPFMFKAVTPKMRPVTQARSPQMDIPTGTGQTLTFDPITGELK